MQDSYCRYGGSMLEECGQRTLPECCPSFSFLLFNIHPPNSHPLLCLFPVHADGARFTSGASSAIWTSIPVCFRSPLDSRSYVSVPWVPHTPHVENGTPQAFFCVLILVSGFHHPGLLLEILGSLTSSLSLTITLVCLLSCDGISKVFLKSLFSFWSPPLP